MKQIAIIALSFIVTLCAYSQTYLQKGTDCFDKGDYACAIKNYDEALKYSSGEDKQNIELKRQRAIRCQNYINSANTAFTNKQYEAAIEEYQEVLESNPKDEYAKSQLETCNNFLNPIPLRKATTAELTDIWNNKYGVNPERRQRLIAAGIDPDDAQSRIRNGEGKPIDTTATDKAITLSVSIQNISVIASGGSSVIDVITNADDYKITYLPSWCKVKSKYSTWFSLECDANNSSQTRNDWFKVIAVNKEVRINVSQTGKTEQNPLRKATTAELTDIWNNKYGTNPGRRQKLIDAGIDPDDAQRRVSNGEGKPVETTTTNKEAITLSVSNQNISFNASGGSSAIDVKTNASDYKVTYLPSWCKVNSLYSTWFLLECAANSSSQTRNDWFLVKAGDKEVKINITQSGTTISSYNNQSNTSVNTTPVKFSHPKCFNCPKTKDTWGLTFGYLDQNTLYSDLKGVQLGLKIEPLFKYGFGLNTGLNLEAYGSSSPIDEFYFNVTAINIPLHLEYRLNFSKWFNTFFYGGAGFNVVSTTDFDDYSLPVTLEYGGGFRINRVQFRVGRSLYYGDFKELDNLGKNIQIYHNFSTSLDVLF